MEAIEQFVIDHGAGNDDFRTPQTDAFNFSPFVYGQASQALGEPRHFRPGDDGALAGTVFAKIAGGGGKRGGGSGGGDYVLNFTGDHARCDAVDFAGDESLQPFEFAFARWIMAEEFVGESDRAQGKTDGFTNLTAGGDGQFAASSAQIHHQSWRIVDAKVGDEAQVNQASFFQAGNDFDRPAGRGAYPLDKCLRVAGVAQGARGDHSDRVGDYLLGCAMKATEDFDGFRHRLGSKKAGAKDALSQTSNFAVFVDRAKMSACEARDLKPNGIGTDINRGKGRHEARPVYMPDGTASSEVKSKILNPGDNGVHRVAMLALSRIALEGSTVGIF